MGGKAGKTVQSTQLDPQTQQYIDEIMAAAHRAGIAQLPGVSPYMQQGADTYANLQRGGNFGLQALMGDQGAVNALMSPFVSNVVDANNAVWKRINGQTAAQLAADATRSGAFGGDRYAVGLGSALSANNTQQAAQSAGLYSSAFADAMQRAGLLAGQGASAAGAGAQLGDRMRDIQISNDPNVQLMNYLKSAFSGLPYGATRTSSETSGGNPFLGALGGLVSMHGLGGAWAGPWGMLGGALLGGLGS